MGRASRAKRERRQAIDRAPIRSHWSRQPPCSKCNGRGWLDDARKAVCLDCAGTGREPPADQWDRYAPGAFVGVVADPAAAEADRDREDRERRDQADAENAAKQTAFRRRLVKGDAWIAGCVDPPGDPGRPPPKPGCAHWSDTRADPVMLRRGYRFVRQAIGDHDATFVGPGDLDRDASLTLAKSLVGSCLEIEERSPRPEKPRGFAAGNGDRDPRAAEDFARYMLPHWLPHVATGDLVAVAENFQRRGPDYVSPRYHARQSWKAGISNALQWAHLVARDQYIVRECKALRGSGQCRSDAAAARVIAARLERRAAAGTLPPDWSLQEREDGSLRPIRAAGILRVIGRDLRRWKCMASAREHRAALADRLALASRPAQPAVRRIFSGRTASADSVRPAVGKRIEPPAQPATAVRSGSVRRSTDPEGPLRRSNSGLRKGRGDVVDQRSAARIEAARPRGSPDRGPPGGPAGPNSSSSASIRDSPGRETGKVRDGRSPELDLRNGPSGSVERRTDPDRTAVAGYQCRECCDLGFVGPAGGLVACTCAAGVAWAERRQAKRRG